jgi:hypothetical protein
MKDKSKTPPPLCLPKPFSPLLGLTKLGALSDNCLISLSEALSCFNDTRTQITFHRQQSPTHRGTPVTTQGTGHGDPATHGDPNNRSGSRSKCTFLQNAFSFPNGIPDHFVLLGSNSTMLIFCTQTSCPILATCPTSSSWRPTAAATNLPPKWEPSKILALSSTIPNLSQTFCLLP